MYFAVPKDCWAKFVVSMAFQKKLQFAVGDIGVNGGIATWLSYTLDATDEDMIRRLGGSTSAEKVRKFRH